jgi:hypothetical protein
MGDNSSSGDGGLDQWVQLLVASDGELQVSGGYSLNLKVLWSVSCEFEDLGSEVLEDGSGVDGRRGSDSGVGADSALEEPVDPSNGELKETAVKHLHLTWSPALADLLWGAFLFFPEPNLPPFPPFPPLPTYTGKRVVRSMIEIGALGWLIWSQGAEGHLPFDETE